MPWEVFFRRRARSPAKGSSAQSEGAPPPVVSKVGKRECRPHGRRAWSSSRPEHHIPGRRRIPHEVRPQADDAHTRSPFHGNRLPRGKTEAPPPSPSRSSQTQPAAAESPEGRPAAIGAALQYVGSCFQYRSLFSECAIQWDHAEPVPFNFSHSPLPCEPSVDSTRGCDEAKGSGYERG